MKKIFNLKNLIVLFCIIALLAIDLATKHVLEGKSITLINNLLYFHSVHNYGAAFSMLSGSRWLFVALTSLIIVGFTVFFLFKKERSWLFNISYILITVGGVGNLIDRIMLGYVRDFISISFFPAIFNVADICITVGVILLLVYIIFFTNKEEKNGNN